MRRPPSSRPLTVLRSSGPRRTRGRLGGRHRAGRARASSQARVRSSAALLHERIQSQNRSHAVSRSPTSRSAQFVSSIVGEVASARDRPPVRLCRVLGGLAQRGELLPHLVDPDDRPCLGRRCRCGRRRRRWTGRRRRGRRGGLLLGARSRWRLGVLANSFSDLPGDVLVRAGVRDLHQLQSPQSVVALLLVTDVFGSQPSVDPSDQPVALLADDCRRCSAARLEQLLVDRGVGPRLGSGDAVGGLLPLFADLVLRLRVRLVDCGVLLLLRELDLPVLVESCGVEVVEVDAGLRRDEIDGSA